MGRYNFQEVTRAPGDYDSPGVLNVTSGGSPLSEGCHIQLFTLMIGAFNGPLGEAILTAVEPKRWCAVMVI